MPIVQRREAHRPDLSDCPPAKRLRGAPGLRIGDMGAMGRILIAGEAVNAILPELAPLAGEIALDTPGKGRFRATGLHKTLQGMGITELVFAGVTTEVCVQTSMRAANDRGCDCLLTEAATDSCFAAFKTTAIEMIVAQGGIVGWATTLTALKAVLEHKA